MTGLLVNGAHEPVEGLRIVNREDEAWCRLDSRDYRARLPREWVRQVIVHTTKGDWPQHVLQGAGPGGMAKRTADYWSISSEGKKTAGGAHIVIDDDGTVACLADLQLDCAYHATTSNEWSIGIEMYQESDGALYQATLVSCTLLVTWLARRFRIPMQHPSRVYSGDAIDRMKLNGGPDMVGLFGHRDNAWDFVHHTSSRGRGDPGDEIYHLWEAAGSEPMDFQGDEDKRRWTTRQMTLNKGRSRDGLKPISVDGLCGPQTYDEMIRQGFASGRTIDSVRQV